MDKLINKKFIVFSFALLFLLGSFQVVQGVDKYVGETTTIDVDCSDSDGNLFQCNVTSPCVQNCPAFGWTGSCLCEYTCVSQGTYNACARARDTLSLIDDECLDTLTCVLNNPPSQPGIPDVYKPSGVSWDNCTFSGKSIPIFHWTYSDPNNDPQAAYEIWIDSDASFADPKFNYIADVAATSYAFDAYHDIEGDWLTALEWNTNYKWKIRVKDTYNNWSDFSSSATFKTPKHAYPYPGFSWLPEEPNQKETVIFTPDETGLFYFWTVIQGEATYVDETGPTNEQPHITFESVDNKVQLKVTDSDAYSCESDEQEITAQLPLPEYQEVAPIIWLKEVFAGITGFLNGFFAFANGH